MNRLKELRVAAGMTQEELGNKVGLKFSAISKYEKGLVPIQAENLIKFAEIFGVSTDYLLGVSNTGTEQKETSPTPEEVYIKALLKKRGILKENEDLSKDKMDRLLDIIDSAAKALKD